MEQDRGPDSVHHSSGIREGYEPTNGQRFWLARSSYCPPPDVFRKGAPPQFSEPQNLYAAVCEYFEHCEQNPIYKTKVTSHEGDAKLLAVATTRPFTKNGLYTFLGCRPTHWEKWKRDEHLGPVVEWAESVIHDQKFAGAITGEYSTNLIIRDLGLADKQEVETTEAPVAQVDDRRIANQTHPDATPEELDAYYAAGKQPPMYSQEQIDAGFPWVPYGG